MRAALFLLALLAAPVARAQGLTAGTWTGTLGAGHGAAPVEATLEACVGGYTVGLKVAGRDAGEAEGVAWAENRLRFRFVEPRSRRALVCALARRTDGSLVGPCAAPRQRPIALTLQPPASAAFGCSS